MALNPDHAVASHNLAHDCFLSGDDQRAWSLLEEARLRMAEPGNFHVIPDLPRWDGADNPQLRLLVVGEQGMGDTLQFLRDCRDLREHVGEVCLCVAPNLVGLARNAGVVDAVLTPEDAKRARCSCWVPVLSLPSALQISERNPGRPGPHLRRFPERESFWQTRIRQERGFIVALHWQGNPVTETQSALRGRSLPLETFAPLAHLPGVRFVSLQKGPGAEQLMSCSFAEAFVACQPEIDASWGLEDAAAILAVCDLVITADSYPVHLAAGMGCPTWLLLAHIPDWRWGLSGEQTFWYPSVRLFRQSRRGDWPGVILRVRDALADHVAAAGLA